jgi:hypothetical protein
MHALAMTPSGTCLLEIALSHMHAVIGEVHADIDLLGMLHVASSGHRPSLASSECSHCFDWSALFCMPTPRFASSGYRPSLTLVWMSSYLASSEFRLMPDVQAVGSCPWPAVGRALLCRLRMSLAHERHKQSTTIAVVTRCIAFYGR